MSDAFERGSQFLKVVRNEDIQEAQRLIAEGLAWADCRQFISLALVSACNNGNVDLVELLLTSCNAPVDAKDESGHSALFSATMKGHVEVVRILLARGASVNDSRFHPLTHACIQGSVAVVEAFLDHGAPTEFLIGHLRRTALIAACEHNQLPVVQLLLKRGVNLEAVNEKRATALLQAAARGYDNIVKTLLAHGANVAHQDYDRCTALFEACENGHVEVVKLLLLFGSDVNAHDSEDCTPLMYASDTGETEVIEVLLDHRSNASSSVQASNGDGCTAFVFAVDNGEFDAVETLLALAAEKHTVELIL